MTETRTREDDVRRSPAGAGHVTPNYLATFLDGLDSLEQSLGVQSHQEQDRARRLRLIEGGRDA